MHPIGESVARQNTDKCRGHSFQAGILPVAFDFYKKPQGHGYTIVTVEGENPYFDVGTEIRGHEFHYSRVSHWTGGENDLVFRMKRGVGIDKDRDGILYKNVLATYTHVHALGTPGWAPALIPNAVKFKKVALLFQGFAVTNYQI